MCLTCSNSLQNWRALTMEMPQEVPSSICLRVTRRCNVACAFCQAPPAARAELSVEEIAGLARFFAARAVRSLKLSGGEPTTRSDLAEIIETVGEADLKPVVITNGFYVSDETVAAAHSHGGEFKFSIHRPSAENDRILRRASFAQIIENIDKVINAEVRLSINTVVTPGVVDSMRSMVDFACDVGAGKISFIPVVSRGRAGRTTAFDFLPNELEAVHKGVADLSALFTGIIEVRCIDIRSHDYWVVENDGSLWIERATEGEDRKICDKEYMLSSI
ncbi:radical SAM protein [Streptomyces avermitilis]